MHLGYQILKVSATVKVDLDSGNDKVDLTSLEREIRDNGFLILAAIASAVNLIVALLR